MFLMYINWYGEEIQELDVNTDKMNHTGYFQTFINRIRKYFFKTKYI